ncbi:SDR family oxidoreductase [Verminephrobacter aporrectodeae subsp. tuberculatae]|nr:3-oxoacyl-ACP reductase FabG [Verminephrobacter aporrectodeae]MCW5257154.1 SDR family oxidoreductase [Verminephrobacter aporrectodeae subsp. tuberculatae]MCW8163574.1 SDR family oxidoreductase [Verminephrobacter aporrectodeae subsp. tuberculatae]MCW8167705.1 SDR family oxidoreductase [Verminephrobacter aporrectodeae subsp. tuberculatae]
MKSDSERWVLVTGGSRGIGRGIVEALVNQYRVVFTYRQESQQAASLVQSLSDKGAAVEAHRCDGVDPLQVNTLAKECLARLGAPWGLIQNAGVTQDGAFVNMTDQVWRHVLSTNLDSCFYTVRAFLEPMLAERRGSVVMMSSITAIHGNPGQVNYAATKAAMLGMTRSLSREVARYRVRVNAIAPGLINTEMVAAMPDERRRAMEKCVPLRRLGRVDEVGALVRYLLSDASEYMTGQTLVLDGGLSA